MKIFNKFKNSEIIYDVLAKVTIVMLIFIAIFAAYFVYLKEPRVQEAVVLATTKKPETFTELYFENHLKLPSVVKVGENYSFEFTVHNLEYQAFEYPYEIYIEANGNRQIINKNKFILNHGGFKTIKENFALKEATRSAVVVNLINKNQAIHFWTEGGKE